MRVFCVYNEEYDRFLKQVVDYVLEEYGADLDISDLQEIELVKEIKDNKQSDGRFEGFGTRIVLAERKYRMLPHLDIQRLKNEDTFKSVVSTLFHEMGHASDMKRMPTMYHQVFDAEGDFTPETAAEMLFLEYVANMRTDALYTGEHAIYCQQVAEGLWNKYRRYPAELAFYYMAKVSVYFVIRTKIHNNRGYFLRKQGDQLFSDFIESFDTALSLTYQDLPFDDCESCYRITEVLKEYMPRFEEKYA